MILIRFPNFSAKRRALGYLLGRFPFKSSASGQMLVPAAALPALVLENIPFIFQGPATYQQILNSPGPHA